MFKEFLRVGERLEVFRLYFGGEIIRHFVEIKKREGKKIFSTNTFGIAASVDPCLMSLLQS